MKDYKAPKNSGVMGHASSPKKLDVFKAQKQDIGKAMNRSSGSKGYPAEAKYKM